MKIVAIEESGDHYDVMVDGDENTAMEKIKSI
jgi:hypothetical protein